jgi:hypothetical protein
VRTDGQRSGRQHTEDKQHRRGGNGRRYTRRPHGRALISLPRGRPRALDQIGQSLAAEDPGLGARFAVFTMLTRHEPMPATEHLPDRRPRFLRRAMLLPLIAISLAVLLAASWLMSSRQTYPAGPNAAAHDVSSLSWAAQCQRSPAISLDAQVLAA